MDVEPVVDAPAEAPSSPTPLAASLPQNANTRRTVISKMVLENFKSWAEKREIGPFHKRFSAVVGPNGSGKSNIIDAMLFVFGKRAKQLRHNKISELIHKSEKFPNLQEARVSVHFVDILDREGEGFDEVAGSEIIITRTATANNQSKYFLNGKLSNWTEIQTLVKGRGIDLDLNRFLILQGEVESIAMMPPKGKTEHETGLLEYLEDIIGTDVYVEKIEAAAKMMEERNEDRTEKLNRVRVIEKDRDGLEGAKAEAEEYLTKEHAIVDKKAILYQHQCMQAKHAAEERLNEKARLEQNLNEEKSKMDELVSELEAIEAEYGRKTQEYDAVAKAMETAKGEFAVYERKDVKFREDLKHLKKKEKKLEETIVKERKTMDEAVAAVAAQKQEIERLEKEAKKLATHLAKEEKLLEEHLERMKDATSELNAQLEKHQKELMPFSKEKTEHANQAELAQSEIALLQERSAGAAKQLSDVREQITQLASAIQFKKKSSKAVEAALAAAQQKLPTLKTRLGEVIASEERIGQETRSIRSRMEEAKATVSSSRSRGQLLESLMEARRTKKLDGIHGRLGDLGTIDAKYDVAISTACGALDNIVVQTTEQAQRAIEFLRKNKLGIATFIVLDKQSHLQQAASTAIQTPENAPRLFDLVKPKKVEFATAFYFALRDTLVADNMEQATRIAFGGQKRFRVVTLDGKVVDISGTMSGGGTRVARGGMSGNSSSGEEISPEEVSKLERELESRTSQLRKLREERERLTAEVETLTGEVARLQVDQKKIDMDIPGLTGQREQLEARLPALVETAKADPRSEQRIAELKTAIRTHEAAIAKASKASQSIQLTRSQGKIEAVQKQIDAAGGAQYKVQREKVAAIGTQQDDNARATTRAQVAVATQEKAVAKAQKAAESAKNELDQTLAQHKTLRDEFDEMTREAAAVMETYQQTQKQLNEQGDELKQAAKGFEQVKKVVADMRRDELDCVNRLEDITKAIREADGVEKALLKKLEDLKRQKARLNADDSAEAAEVSIPELQEAELEKISVDRLKNEIGVLEEEKNSMKPNMGAIQEYRKKQAEYERRVAELEAVTAARDAARKEYEDLRKQRLTEFMAGFSVITMKLKEMYQMITLGGDAELELVDSLDPFSEGIVFSVRPPRKNWKNIQNLSGGEKTLSSLALVFALHHYKPTPLYVMDEIDAALDFKNVSIVANYIKERTKNAQFVIISLRNNMFEMSDRMVGVFKTRDCSKSVTIVPNAFHVDVSVH